MALSVGAALTWAGTLWELARKAYGFLEAQQKAAKAIAALDEDIRALKLEVERLKGREEVPIARAEAAASGADTAVVSNTVADTARRIIALEEHARRRCCRPKLGAPQLQAFQAIRTPAAINCLASGRSGRGRRHVCLLHGWRSN